MKKSIAVALAALAGGLYDAFELLPDGTVKEVLPDIVEVPSFSLHPA